MAAPTEWLRSDASGRFVLRVPSGAIDLRVEPRPSRLAERVAQAIAVRPDESSPALEVEVGARDEPR